MKSGIQSFFTAAGETACYALSVIKIAELETNKKFDVLTALEAGIDKKFIRFNYENYSDNYNFFMDYPDRFLSYLTGDIWSVQFETADYIPRDGEYVVERWERKKTGATTAHFRLPDWDSLRDSQTVKYGQIVSTRLFRRLS
jgi:hypothetical protein